MAQHKNNFVQCQNPMTEAMKYTGHEHVAVFPTLIRKVLSVHQIIGESSWRFTQERT